MLIHDALKDYITCGDTSVEAYQLRLAIRDMDKEEDGQSGFEQQFEVRTSNEVVYTITANILHICVYVSLWNR